MAAALSGHETRADAATRALPAGEATSVLDLAAGGAGASTAMMPTVGVPSSVARTAPTTPAPAATRRGAAHRRRSGPSPVVWVLLAAVVALVGILGYVLLSGSDAPTAAAPGTRPSATSGTPRLPAVHDGRAVRRQHRPRRARRPAARCRGRRA